MFTDFITECRAEKLNTKNTPNMSAIRRKENHILDEVPERIAVAA